MQDKIMQTFEPLFIVGYPRSGTTLLLHILRSTNAYPSYTFSETHFFSHYYRRSPYGNLSSKKQQQRLLTDIAASSWFQESGLQPTKFIAAFKEKEITYRSILSFFMESIAVKQGKTRWLEKTPWHMIYLREIIRTYPNAKFLFLVRDPRSVVQSVYKAGWTKAVTKGPLRVAAAWRWHNIHAEKILKTITEHYICITYEDLILSNEKVGKQVGDFLGIEFDINLINRDELSSLAQSNSSYRDNIVGLSQTPLYRWQKTMDVNLMSAVEYIAGADIMARYGYSKFAPELSSVIERSKFKQISVIYSVMKEMRQLLFPLVRR